MHSMHTTRRFNTCVFALAQTTANKAIDPTAHFILIKQTFALFDKFVVMVLRLISAFSLAAQGGRLHEHLTRG